MQSYIHTAQKKKNYGMVFVVFVCLPWWKRHQYTSSTVIGRYLIVWLLWNSDE